VSPDTFYKARKSLGLTQSQMAERLRLGANGRRTIRRYETGETPVTGPVSVAVELMLRTA
jgi:transcriptional regulator with XRE-family HTH domain